MGAGDHVKIGDHQAAFVPDEAGAGAAWNLLHIEGEKAAAQGGVGDIDYRGTGLAKDLRGVGLVLSGESSGNPSPRGSGECGKQAVQEHAQACVVDTARLNISSPLGCKSLLECANALGVGTDIADTDPRDGAQVQQRALGIGAQPDDDIVLEGHDRRGVHCFNDAGIAILVIDIPAQAGGYCTARSKAWPRCSGLVQHGLQVRVSLLLRGDGLRVDIQRVCALAALLPRPGEKSGGSSVSVVTSCIGG